MPKVYYDARQAGIFDSSSGPRILTQSLSLLWYSGSSFHRYSVFDSSILRIMPKVYYDARQAGIFDSSSVPRILTQSLSLLWYSDSSFHRYSVFDSSILRIMPKVFRRIAIRARP